MAQYRLQLTDGRNVTATLHWDESVVARQPRPDDGLVLVLIEYRIAPEQSREFARAMHALRLVRLRDGAIRWGLFGDTADLRRYIESLFSKSNLSTCASMSA